HILQLLRHVPRLPRRRTAARLPRGRQRGDPDAHRPAHGGFARARRGLGGGGPLQARPRLRGRPPRPPPGGAARPAAWGAASPSSHVAVSVPATVAALGEWRALGLVLVVPTTLLILGSVYGQFHYGVDALAGIGVGLLVALGARLTSRRDASSDHRAGAGRRPLDDSTRAAHASSSSRPIRAAEKPSRTVCMAR